MSESAYDAAWRIHAAQVDWTGKVDTKASFAFAIESAALAVVVALSAKDRTYYAISSVIERALYWGGVTLLLLGAACALLVVFPRLRASKVKKEAPVNYIYFGHLKRWSANDLVWELESGDHVKTVAQQCINMAHISWRKHRLVQWSMLLGGIGILALVVCGTLCTIQR